MPLLAAGAGAAEGLDTMLQRMMLEEQLRQRGRGLDEEIRHNKADEGLRGKQLDELATSRATTETDRKNALIDKTVSNRGIGDEVTPEEMTRETGAGYPSGVYDKKDPTLAATKLSGFSSLPGDVGELGGGSPAARPAGGVTVTSEAAQPSRILFKGTEAQRLNRKKEEDALTNRGGTESQKTFKLKNPQLAQQFGMKVGDVITPLLNTKTGAYTLQGVPLQPGRDMDFYEKPPAPDRALIQTGTGYMTRAQARQILQNGGNVPLATTAQTRNRMDQSKMTVDKIPYVEGLADRLDEENLFGPVMSRLRTLATKAGSVSELADLAGSDDVLQADGLAGEFATALPLLSSAIAISHYGGNAGRSAASIQMFRDMFSDAGTLDLFKGKLKAADKFIGSYAAGPNGKGMADQPKDLYQEYLDRVNKK